MCINCDEIIQVGNSGTDGWSPILALYEGECDGDAVTVHQLVSWQEGSGTRPIYNGNIMTDAWLAAHPIYLGSAGFVTDICEATNLQPANGANGAAGATGATGATGEAGNDGCNPLAEISLTFEDGTGEPGVGLTVDFIQSGEACNQSFDASLDPVDFAESDFFNQVLLTETFTNGVATAVETYLSAEKTVDSSVSIGSVANVNTATYDFNYTIITGGPTLAIDPSVASYTAYKVIGNLMILNFRLVLINNGTFGTFATTLKVPGGYTFSNALEINAIGSWVEYYAGNSGDKYQNFVIGNIAGTNNTLLRIGVTNIYGDITGWGLSSGQRATLMGQIMFTIN